MFPFLPFGDRVIIKVKNEYPKKEIKGIVVPKIVKNPSLQGTVVAVGTGRIFIFDFNNDPVAKW